MPGRPASVRCFGAITSSRTRLSVRSVKAPALPGCKVSMPGQRVRKESLGENQVRWLGGLDPVVLLFVRLELHHDSLLASPATPAIVRPPAELSPAAGVSRRPLPAGAGRQRVRPTYDPSGRHSFG